MSTVLLADDSLSVARAIELAFLKTGIRVLTVASGERALSELEAEQPDAILADIGLARISGYDIATYVKNRPALKHIPVLLLIGPFDRVDEARARATGCDGVVVKPIDAASLVSLVRAVLRGERPAALWPEDMPRVGTWDPAPSLATRPEVPAAPVVTASPIAPTPAVPVVPEAAVEGPRIHAFEGDTWKVVREGLPGRPSEEFDADLDRLDEAFAMFGSSSPGTLSGDDAEAFALDLSEVRQIGRAHV